MRRVLGWVLLVLPVVVMGWLGLGMLRRGLGGGGTSKHRSELNAEAGLGSRPASLHGVYGTMQGQELEPVLRVDDVKDGYQFLERVEGEWQPDPEPPHTASEAEVEQALGLTSVTGFPVYGLVTGRAMLLKVPPGWTAPAGGRQVGFTTKTGFVLVNGQRLVEAKKVELGGR